MIRSLAVNAMLANGTFNQKTRPYYTIFCFLTPFVYLNNNKLHQGERGDILIYPPNSTIYYGAASDTTEPLIYDWLILQNDKFEELLSKYSLPLNESFSTGESSVVHEYAKRLYPEWSSNKIGRSDMIQSLMTEMIINTHRIYSKNDHFNKSNNKITFTKHRVLSDVKKNWTLKEMAALSGYSVSRFSELYRKQYGVSPINELINHRIALAKDLLLIGKESVTDIAEICGFGTINYFSKYFKKATGYTPSEYTRLFGNDEKALTD